MAQSLHAQSLSAQDRPTVLIVGGGVGGLALGLLLERAEVPYSIFERAATIKPLGSALAMGASVASLFRQLGIYEQFTQLSLVSHKVNMRDQHCVFDYSVDFSPLTEMGGSEPRVTSRPAVYDLLQRQVPAEKINFNKKVASLTTTDTGVRLTCTDGSEHEGDIVVGADGANSVVRRELFARLKEKGQLPNSDDTLLPYDCICVVGQTGPLPLETFPEMQEATCQSNQMVGVGNPYTWITFTTKHRTICWMALQYFEETKHKGEDVSTEWGPEATEAMCIAVRDFPIPNGPAGSTLGTLIDLTPKDLISKVTLEEKVFQTWFSGRIVLMGDACHKLSPSGGSGAATAIHDAVCLANWINVLPAKPGVEAIERVFHEYYNERLPIAIEQFRKSQYYAMTSSKTMTAAVVRFVQRRMPRWLWIMILRKTAVYRPQVSFLPLVKDSGTVPAAPQNSLIKTLEILASRKAPDS
ncbi:hypothetical protein EMPS_04030 [Entomortierella parvispora]|uniref:FAD-binding domain-containing protein n=1 Tax=Entomortierella parvispora TaxID=205924 RepID=A0A9P3LVF1_9FUNG|nr:hypothetical protein EMPS_04030 [Entomortierella parvispora]